MISLRKGDKVRLKSSGEAGEIVAVESLTKATIETFDGEIEINASEVEPFQASDVRKNITDDIQFIKEIEQQKKKEAVDLFSMNSRKNRFKYEIDLHAEILLGDISTKSNEEILSLQLSKLKDYLREAIDLYIQRVYVIHGIGSGRLKSEVEQLLLSIPEVKQFDNHYHPKYGKGATEVKLR